MRSVIAARRREDSARTEDGASSVRARIALGVFLMLTAILLPHGRAWANTVVITGSMEGA